MIRTYRIVVAVDTAMNRRQRGLPADRKLVTMDCGHVATCNPVGVQLIGERKRCYQCEKAAGLPLASNR